MHSVQIVPLSWDHKKYNAQKNYVLCWKPVNDKTLNMLKKYYVQIFLLNRFINFLLLTTLSNNLLFNNSVNYVLTQPIKDKTLGYFTELTSPGLDQCF